MKELRQRPDLEAIWQKFCPGADTLLERYARSHNGELGIWAISLPSRQVIWRNEAADYTVSMMTNLVPPYRLDVWGSAWKPVVNGSSDREVVHLPSSVFRGSIDNNLLRVVLADIDRGLIEATRVLLGISQSFPIVQMSIK